MLNYILVLINVEKRIVSVQGLCVCIEKGKKYHPYVIESATRITFIKQQPELHYAFSGI